MTPLPYDEDELITRLRTCGCTVKREGVKVRSGPRHNLVEVYVITLDGRTTQFRIPDDDQPLYAETVENVLRRLNLGGRARVFGVNEHNCHDERH